MQGVWVRCLVEELRSQVPRSHMLPLQKKQNIKQRQYCNKFKKDFKDGSHKKKKSP